MAQKVMIEDKEYDVDHLSEAGKSRLLALTFVTAQIKERINHKAVLQRAKNSYLESLKKEMLSDKAGFLFGES